MKIDDLAGKRIAILGAGREGQAAYLWLKQRLPGQPLQLFAEAAAAEEFVGSLAAGDELHIGPLDEARLKEFELLLRSPGISPYRPALQGAVAAGCRIVSPSSLWFAAHPDAKTICITGTKGKSTTSALTAHMLKSCGQRVQLAGNIGKPLLACDNADNGESDPDWWVIELSSYQLCDLQARPNIGVILNLSPEHLDWHGGFDIYMRDKLRLAELVEPGGLIINATDPLLVERFGSEVAAKGFNFVGGIWFEGRQFMSGDTPIQVEMPSSMPGRHNRSNVAAALSVIRKAGFVLEMAIDSLGSYQSLPHRLEVLGERAGVCWINDSISTTPVATSAALEALAGKPIILLLGGLDRGLDWSRYSAEFHAHSPKAVITMPDSGRLLASWMRNSGMEFSAGLHEAGDLREAVELARRISRPGDLVLLSPGAPSFPRFEDFQHRGREFARLAGF